MNTIELTETEVGIHPLIKMRWSPRAFSTRKIGKDSLEKIFTAASWAASAMNEQPWHYIYAINGTEGFEKLWSSLNPTNQIWTKNVPVIFAAFYRQNYSLNGKPNRAAMHDLGMANAHLMLQAVSEGIYGHLLGGFDKEKLADELQISGDLVPFVMGVLGYPGDPEKLEEPFRTRESKPRTRRSIEEFVVRV